MYNYNEEKPWWQLPSTAIVAILVIVFIAVVPFFAYGQNYILYRTFAPLFEGARREVFEQTKSYQEGMVQQLTQEQFEYIKASPEHKAALATIILHQVADFKGELPEDLSVFIQKLREERTENHSWE